MKYISAAVLCLTPCASFSECGRIYIGNEGIFDNSVLVKNSYVPGTTAPEASILRRGGYNTAVGERLLSITGLTHTAPGVPQTTDDMRFYGVRTSGAYGAASATMSTIAELTEAETSNLAQAGYDTDDIRFKIAYSQYKFFHDFYTPYVVGEGHYNSTVAPPTRNKHTPKEKQDTIISYFPAINEQTRDQADNYILGRMAANLFTPDSVSTNGEAESSWNLSGEEAFHLSYSLTASDVARDNGEGSPDFAGELFQPIRDEYNTQIEWLKRVATTLDRDELVRIRENGFGDDVEDEFRIGENDMDIDADTRIPELHALAAAGIKEANINIEILFDAVSLQSAEIVPFPCGGKE